MKLRSFFSTLLHTILGVVLLGLVVIGCVAVKCAFDFWREAMTPKPAVTVETPQEAATRKAHEANPVYDLSMLDDDELRVLKTGSSGPSTVILHGSKVVFRDAVNVFSAEILTDQLSGERKFIWDPESRTLLNKDGEVCYRYEKETTQPELMAKKYGDLLAIYGAGHEKNNRYAEELALQAVIDLTTGEALPLPEHACGFVATGERLLFTCYEGEDRMNTLYPEDFHLIVEDYAGNTLYTREHCLVFAGGYSDRWRGETPWVMMRVCRTGTESEDVWFDPLTQEETAEYPVNEREMPEGAEGCQSNGGYTAYFFPDNTVWVANKKTGALCGKVRLDSRMAEEDLDFLTWTEDGRAIFSVPNRSSHQENIVDNNGKLLIWSIDTVWEENPLPAGLFRTENGSGVGWMDIYGNWAYFEPYPAGQDEN